MPPCRPWRRHVASNGIPSAASASTSNDGLQRATGPARFDGVRRIGIDETSFKKGHRYLMVVVDHDRGCLVWVAEGWSREALRWFLKEELTREQGLGIEVVTADGRRWIKTPVERGFPNVEWVMGPFRIVSWMNDALDGVRREERQVAEKATRAATSRRGCPGKSAAGDETPPETLNLAGAAKEIKGTRFALAKGRESLTDSQRAKLDRLKPVESRLFRTWEPQEDLCAVFRTGDATEAERLLDDWLHRAAYCKIAKVVAVEKKVRRRRDDILRAVSPDIGNARVESINNKIKVTVKMGYGFRSTDNLLALLMLRCSDAKPQLPWNQATSVRKVA